MGFFYWASHFLLYHERVHVDVRLQAASIGWITGRAVLVVLLGGPFLFELYHNLFVGFYLIARFEVAFFYLLHALLILDFKLIQLVEVHLSDCALVILKGGLDRLSLIVDAVGVVTNLCSGLVTDGSLLH